MLGLDLTSDGQFLVIVDLYPFEETVRSGASEEAIIEKIDIGGIALIFDFLSFSSGGVSECVLPLGSFF